VTSDVPSKKYFLLDASVVVAYYLPKVSSQKAHERMHEIVSAMRVRGRQKKPFVLFVPNFCVAEIFNTFRRCRYGKWNKKVKDIGGMISKKDFNRVYNRFQQDIRNGKLFYHYELSRYHLLNTALISPIDHHYAYQRNRTDNRRNPRPMSTFDLLIIAMGIELVRLHGKESVCILTTDSRIVNISRRAEQIKTTTAEKLDLTKAARLVGRNCFSRSLYPKAFNLSKGKEKDFNKLLT